MSHQTEVIKRNSSPEHKSIDSIYLSRLDERSRLLEFILKIFHSFHSVEPHNAVAIDSECGRSLNENNHIKRNYLE